MKKAKKSLPALKNFKNKKLLLTVPLLLLSFIAFFVVLKTLPELKTEKRAKKELSFKSAEIKTEKQKRKEFEKKAQEFFESREKLGPAPGKSVTVKDLLKDRRSLDVPIPTPTIINGIEVYGTAENPLTVQQHQTLFLKKETERGPNLDPNIINLELGITADQYRGLVERNQDPIVLLQEIADRLLEDRRNPLGNYHLDQTRVNISYILVLEEGVKRYGGWYEHLMTLVNERDELEVITGQTFHQARWFIFDILWTYDNGWRGLNDPYTRNMYVGGAAHEIGHGLSLGHITNPGRDSDSYPSWIPRDFLPMIWPSSKYQSDFMNWHTSRGPHDYSIAQFKYYERGWDPPIFRGYQYGPFWLSPILFSGRYEISSPRRLWPDVSQIYFRPLIENAGNFQLNPSDSFFLLYGRMDETGYDFTHRELITTRLDSQRGVFIAPPPLAKQEIMAGGAIAFILRLTTGEVYLAKGGVNPDEIFEKWVNVEGGQRPPTIEVVFKKVSGIDINTVLSYYSFPTLTPTPTPIPPKTWTIELEPVCPSGDMSPSVRVKVGYGVASGSPPSSWQFDDLAEGRHTIQINGLQAADNIYLYIEDGNGRPAIPPNGNPPHPAIKYNRSSPEPSWLVSWNRTLPEGTYRLKFSPPFSSLYTLCPACNPTCGTGENRCHYYYCGAGNKEEGTVSCWKGGESANAEKPGNCSCGARNYCKILNYSPCCPPTPIPKPCNRDCSNNNECDTKFCYLGHCRNQNCRDETDCKCWCNRTCPACPGCTSYNEGCDDWLTCDNNRGQNSSNKCRYFRCLNKSNCDCD